MGLFPDDEPKEPAGTYQVWHKETDGYHHVANVECGNRLAALVLPQINKDEPETKRVTPLVDDARPITYGDVIVDPDHTAYEIYKPDFGGTAFREIDFGKELFKQILAEQRTDYQAAGLRDTGQDYEKFLKEATERAQAGMQGKDGGHER